MPLGIVLDGKVLDFKYKKVSTICYNFYIGHNILVGQLFKKSKTDWACVSWTDEEIPLRALDGFRSRYKASQCLLKMGGYEKQ